VSSALGARFKDPGKGIADAQEDKQPEDAHESCNGKTAGSHQEMREVDVDDDRSQQGKREGNVAINKQENPGNDLEERYDMDVVSDGKGTGEVGHRTRGHGRIGEEVKENVGAKEHKDDPQQVAGDRGGNLHGILLERALPDSGTGFVAKFSDGEQMGATNSNDLGMDGCAIWFDSDSVGCDANAIGSEE
jgi:hypothetical protein